MPEGVNVEVDGPYARISFPDRTKRGAALRALLASGAPIQIRTGGLRREYIVPEGNAREAGLLDEPKKQAKTAAAPRKEPEQPKTQKTDDTAAEKESAAKKVAPAKKAVPSKKAASKEADSGKS